MEEKRIINCLVAFNTEMLNFWTIKEKTIGKSGINIDLLTSYERIRRELKEGFEQILRLCKRKNIDIGNIEDYVEYVAKELPIGKLKEGEGSTKLFELARYTLLNIDYTDSRGIKGYPVTFEKYGVIHISMGIIIYIRQISYDVIHNIRIANMGKGGANHIQTHAVEGLLTYTKILITMGIRREDVKW